MPRWPVALVTGASSGIGRAIAVQLAADGSDLIVVARRRDKLDELAQELRAAHGVTVDVVVADVTDPEQLAALEDRLRTGSPSVDLLVNNAGAGGQGAFAELPLERHESQIRLNVLAPVRLTHAALGPMLARGRGGVLNVSSIAGLQPMPYVTTYAATKAYLSSFSHALHEEVRGHGVVVTNLLPGFTRTEFHDAAQMSRAMAALHTAIPRKSGERRGCDESRADSSVIASGQAIASIGSSALTPSSALGSYAAEWKYSISQFGVIVWNP